MNPPQRTRSAAHPPPRLTVTVSRRTLVGLVVALVAVAGAVGLVRTAPWMLTQIAMGILLALALDPVVLALRRRLGWSRARAVALLAVVLTTVAAAVVLLLGPAAVRQAGDLADQLPETVREGYGLPLLGPVLEDRDAAEQVQQWFDELPAHLDLETMTSTVGTVLGGVRTIVVVVLVAVSVMLDGDALVARARRILPGRSRRRADEVGRIAYTAIGSYFAGSLLVAVLNGTVTLAVGLLLGIPLVAFAAVWSALTNLIPQIGGFLGGVVLVSLALTQGPLAGVIALAVFLAYQQLENNVIAPAIVGRALDLSPLTTMIAALVGGAAAGIPGALVATPLVGAVKALALRRERRSDPPVQLRSNSSDRTGRDR